MLKDPSLCLLPARVAGLPGLLPSPAQSQPTLCLPPKLRPSRQPPAALTLTIRPPWQKVAVPDRPFREAQLGAAPWAGYAVLSLEGAPRVARLEYHKAAAAGGTARGPVGATKHSS